MNDEITETTHKVGVSIFVNNREVHFPNDDATGAEIKARAEGATRSRQDHDADLGVAIRGEEMRRKFVQHRPADRVHPPANRRPIWRERA